MRLLVVCVLISGCAPPLELDAEFIDFEVLSDCQVHTRELTLRNAGDEPLTVNVSRVDEFIVEPTDNVTLPPRESVSVRITFDAKLGARSQQRTLKIRHDGKVIHEVPVFVTVVHDDFASLNFDFGEVAVDDVRTILWLSSVPGATLDGLADSSFAASTNQPAMEFTPLEPRPHNAVGFRPKPGRCPDVLELRGTGIPALIASPAELQFDGQNQAVVTLTNMSTRDLHVTDISVNDAEFTVSPTVTISPALRDGSNELHPSGARFSVSWSPTQSGSKRAELSMRIDRPSQTTLRIPISATAP